MSGGEGRCEGGRTVPAISGVFSPEVLPSEDPGLRFARKSAGLLELLLCCIGFFGITTSTKLLTDLIVAI